jgi:pyruvate,water dikinase
MSFAGQYSSYLNVTEEDLLEKVILCWQSLWHVRAMDYRYKQGIKGDFSHSVVVQEMVNSHISGVAFTANPMTGLRDQMVVNASWGLGEAIVSGEVNPDQYVVDRLTGEVIDEQIQDKLIQYR